MEKKARQVLRWYKGARLVRVPMVLALHDSPYASLLAGRRNHRPFFAILVSCQTTAKIIVTRRH